MPYIGKKPADIIATVIDTTTGTFSGEVDAGSLDVSGNADIDGITNLDNTDIDGTLDVSGEVITADDIKFTSGSRHKFVGGGTGNNLELGTYSSNNTSRDVHLQIDSAGNVGIGTSSPSTILTVSSGASSASVHSYSNLEIESSSHSALQFSGSTAAEQWIWFADDTTATPVGGITYYHAGPYMGFRVEGSERMRIDSSGNVLVGKTSTGAEFAGITLGSSGYASFTRDSNISLFLNRETNDGTIVEFRKDNTAVGSIGNDNTTDLVITATDDMFFNVAGASNNILQLFGGSGANSQAKFDGHVYPLTDNANDLGNTSERFRHIYISGGIHLGGTGSANELDDYEEGSYQPTITGGTSGSMTTGDSATYLLYTKIGNTVHVQGQIHITASTAVGTILVSLPFASGDTSGLAERSAGGGVIFDSSSGGVTYPTNTVDCCPYVTTGASVFQFRVSISGGGAASLSDTHIGASDRFAVSITYKTA